MRRLRQLIREALPGGLSPEGVPDISFNALSCDSRTINPGDVFIALRGARDDGSRHIEDALRRGAVAVLGEEAPSVPPSVPFIPITDGRRTVARLASWYYDDPAKDLIMVGVTGTNGKTTTTYLLEHLWRKKGFTPGVIGTVGTRFGAREIPATETTPGPLKLQETLDRMRKAGCGHVAMEVSSHALDQRRTDGIAFAAAIFTNLTQDHLDYHRTMEAYFDAKARLFEELPVGASAVLNLADPWGAKLRERTRARIVTYGSEEADFRAADVRDTPEGTSFRLEHPKGQVLVRIPLHGSFNVMNVLGAVSCAAQLGMLADEAALALSDFPGVPGRMESVRLGQDFTVLIDFAHTPDGLENVLRAAKGPGRLLLVFGCGGDRDRTKRPLMAAIAARYADQVIITSDNPRSEDPKEIAREICLGFPKDFDRYRVVIDRRKAIREALLSARPGDRVILAGKGHERSQVIGTEAIPFSDRDEAERVLNGR